MIVGITFSCTGERSSMASLKMSKETWWPWSLQNCPRTTSASFIMTLRRRSSIRSWDLFRTVRYVYRTITYESKAPLPPRPGSSYLWSYCILSQWHQQRHGWSSTPENVSKCLADAEPNVFSQLAGKVRWYVLVPVVIDVKQSLVKGATENLPFQSQLSMKLWYMVSHRASSIILYQQALNGSCPT